MSTSPARAAAFDILLRIEQQDAYASELLHSSQYAKLSPADHGLATELVMGVLRWRSLLDAEISRFSNKGVEKLDIEVLTALRLAAYQLLFLDRIPGRAAVHESVELVKRARKGSAAPFANAVLRKLAEVPRRLEPPAKMRSSSRGPSNCRGRCRRNWRIRCGWWSAGCGSSAWTGRGRFAATTSMLRRLRFVWLTPARKRN